MNPTKAQVAEDLLRELTGPGEHWAPTSAAFLILQQRLRALILSVYGEGSSWATELDKALDITTLPPVKMMGGGDVFIGEAPRDTAYLPVRVAALLSVLVEELRAERTPKVGFPRRYLWTSPVYLAEGAGRKVGVPKAWLWMGRHKVPSLLVGVLSVVGTVLAILTTIGVIGS